MSASLDRRAFLQAAGTVILTGGFASFTQARPAPLESPLSLEGEICGSSDPWIEIDLKAIEFNLGQLKKKVGGRPILAVLKCNAYGHGLVGVARHLEKLSVSGFVVGKLSEALALRAAGIRLPVLNLGPFSARDAETIVSRGISQTVYTDAVLALEEWAKELNTRATVHIEIDTGLGRVGVRHEEALSFVRRVARLQHVRVEGIFQSFSEDPAFDKIQLSRFLAVTSAAQKEGLSVGFRHASASTAIFSYGEEYYLDAVRPGISLYGHYPTDEEHRLKRIELRPALALKACAAYVKDLRPGDSLSYFQKFVAKKPERIVTAALGYSDGVPGNLANRASALIRGQRFPFIADITANHSYFLVTGNKAIVAGDEIVLVGHQEGQEVPLWDLAQAVGISDYKILIGLNPNLPRVYSA